MSELELDGVTKVYDDGHGTETAVDDLSLTAESGEFIVLVGPSGCGKSTTLRMLAGLESVTSGTITLGGNEMQDQHPRDRSIAMVFQDFALYSRMSARENLGYGLKHSTDLDSDEIQTKVDDAADMLGIRDQLDQYPGQLSGGQKQRVALGRAIVREPDLFLMDEPLANLDAKLRNQMRSEIQNIQKKLGTTTVYVTHDQKEAMTMGDRVAILDDGVLQQLDYPERMYDRPTNEFVGSFIGKPDMNRFDGRVTASGAERVVTYEEEVLTQLSPEVADGLPTDSPLRVGIRPEDIVITPRVSDSELRAEVDVVEYHGNYNYVHVTKDDLRLRVKDSKKVTIERGDHVGVALPASGLHFFDPSSGRSLLESSDESGDEAVVRSTNHPGE